MKNGYREQLDSLRFSEEQKAQMVDRLMEAQTQPVIPYKKRTPLRRMAAIGIAAAVVMTVGAGAIVVYNKLASESFAGVFGTAQTEIVDKIGRPIGASDTDNGVTITADAIIGDKYHYAIAYTIAKEDGTAFDLGNTEPIAGKYLPLRFSEWDTSIGYLGGMHGSSYFYDANPGDNTIQYVEMREADGKLPHGIAKARFEDLRLANGDDERIIAEGKWTLKFNFDFEDTSVSLPAGQTFDLNGMTATIDKITLSPIAMRVDYTVDREVQWDDKAESGRQSEQDREQMMKYFESVSIVLTKTDGTTLDLSNAGGSIEPKNGKTVCQKGDVFDEIVPLEEVDHITVAGIEIPVAE